MEATKDYIVNVVRDRYTERQTEVYTNKTQTVWKETELKTINTPITGAMHTVAVTITAFPGPASVALTTSQGESRLSLSSNREEHFLGTRIGDAMSHPGSLCARISYTKPCPPGFPKSPEEEPLPEKGAEERLGQFQEAPADPGTQL